MRISSTLEGKYPIVENTRWVVSRKKELLKVLDSCEDEEREEILSRLGMSGSEIDAMRNDISLEESNRKSNESIGMQVRKLINMGNKRADVGDIEGDFTEQEQEILRVLKLYNGKVVHKGILHKATEKEYGSGTEQKIVDVLVCKIREKFSQDCPYDIETVWGRGYKLVIKTA